MCAILSDDTDFEGSEGIFTSKPLAGHLQDAQDMETEEVGLLEISAKPDGGGRAKTQFCDNLVSCLKNPAYLDRVEVLGFVTDESFFLKLLMRWENGEAAAWYGARLNRRSQ